MYYWSLNFHDDTNKKAFLSLHLKQLIYALRGVSCITCCGEHNCLDVHSVQKQFPAKMQTEQSTYRFKLEIEELLLCYHFTLAVQSIRQHQKTTALWRTHMLMKMSSQKNVMMSRILQNYSTFKCQIFDIVLIYVNIEA